jgi:fatty acid desaturase
VPTYDQSIRPARRAFLQTVGAEALRELHRCSGWRHLGVALQPLGVLAAAVFVVLRYGDRWYAWIPASVAIGFAIFSLTVLLHEVVHGVVFTQRRPRAERVLAYLYAVASGLAPTQFFRWHLDHHDHLGTADQDPKRAWLTPKRVRRWFKALYLTPALFPIYFRAARQAAVGYPADVRRRIRHERILTTSFHLLVLAGIVAWGGWLLALKLYGIPVFFVFPVAFTLNRLGQHYDVDPTDPARWGTLMRPSPWLWDRVFLWSNYHLEHHYFPRVPCYRLPALRRALEPFFAAREVPSRSYAGLLRQWFAENRVPHTDWSQAACPKIDSAA